MKMRPFTKTDWYGFAGAETDTDTNPPTLPHISDTDLTVDGHPGFIIADRNGIEVYQLADAYALTLNRGAALNIHIANALGDTITIEQLEALGFRRS